MVLIRYMKISSDNRLNSVLKKELSTMRGVMVIQAETLPLPRRFKVEPSKHNPTIFITDTTSKKTVEVPLFAYGEVRKALASLFP